MPASLFQRTFSKKSLTLAWQKVQANNGAAGVDGITIAGFENSLDSRLHGLAKAVLEECYTPQALRECWIPKSAESESFPPAPVRWRRLAIPAVADRVLQTAVALALEPLIEKHLADCSFAYRQGRSVKQAVARVQAYRDQGFCWVVDADVERFFDTVPHAPLMTALAQVVHDKKMLGLVAHWLRTPIWPTERGSNRLQETPRLPPQQEGIPQGSPLSPMLANLYLDTLDDAVLDANHRMVRFADDFVILCRTQDQAHEALELSQEVLQALELKLSSHKTRVVDFNQGFKFLGTHFVRSLAIPAKPAAPAPMATTPRPKAAHGLPQSAQAVPESPGPAGASPLDSAMQQAFGELPAQELAQWAEQLPASSQQVAPPPAPAEQASQQDAPQADAPSPPPWAWLDVRATLTPMPLLRSLYLVQQGAQVTREGEALHIDHEDQRLAEVPLEKLDLVLVFGNVDWSTPALQACMKRGIAVMFHDLLGRPYGMGSAAGTESATRIKAQVQSVGNPQVRLGVAKAMVRAKISNSRRLLARWAASRKNDTASAQALHAIRLRLRDTAWRSRHASTLDKLRGHEGAAAAAYFEAIRLLLPAQWPFPKRVPRPAPDAVNALLSFGYSLLRANAIAVLQMVGLHTAIGILHEDKPGHSSLASDLMEEFRAPVVDAIVMDMLVRPGLLPQEFYTPNTEGAACQMSPTVRKRLVHAFEEKMLAPITRPTGKEPVNLRHVLLEQAQRLAQAVGEAGTGQYQPYLMS